ncbi:hypothetical protein E4U19_002434 [Claviceps sp. Clav32 group G5]|nr:hypothetical protein E4U19_002434 [Claviceps sp. Clav32 group G5]KAG6046028.1 hypothetical protein E4U39_001727 [Claviceps sp. Clav50 group G5]
MCQDLSATSTDLISDSSAGNSSPRISSCTVRLTPDEQEDRARLLQCTPTASVLLDDDGTCCSRPCRGKVYRLYWAVICLALLSEALLAGLAVVMIRQKRTSGPASTPSWLPPEQSIQTIFQPDELYVGERTPESEKAWKALMPEGLGIVTVRDTTALPALPRLDQSLTAQNAMVSVYHQMHCLYRARQGYFVAAAGNASDVELGHLSHCWDYLRQSIMCSADTTLEWMGSTPDEDGTTGWGYQHKCRDWSAVFSWAEENRRRD